MMMKAGGLCKIKNRIEALQSIFLKGCWLQRGAAKATAAKVVARKESESLTMVRVVARGRSRNKWVAHALYVFGACTNNSRVFFFSHN